jgi:hypothetical protein
MEGLLKECETNVRIWLSISGSGSAVFLLVAKPFFAIFSIFPSSIIDNLLLGND